VVVVFNDSLGSFVVRATASPKDLLTLADTIRAKHTGGRYLRAARR
jgi:hypothetical protein